MRFPAKIISSCIWVAIPVELFYIGMTVVRTDGQWSAVGGRRSVYGHVITKFSEMGRFTYPWCSAGARLAININIIIIIIIIIVIIIARHIVMPSLYSCRE